MALLGIYLGGGTQERRVEKVYKVQKQDRIISQVFFVGISINLGNFSKTRKKR